jgi:hypothetical protein
MKRKLQLLLFFCIFSTLTLKAQKEIVVAVDGFFTNKDSNYVVNHLGEGYIKETIIIPPDSAQVLIGEIGKSGIINIVTIDPKSKKSRYFRLEDNSLFENNPSYFINNKEVDKSEISLLDPSKIISVNFISQLKSAQLYGKERKYGVILVTIKEE